MDRLGEIEDTAAAVDNGSVRHLPRPVRIVHHPRGEHCRIPGLSFRASLNNCILALISAHASVNQSDPAKLLPLNKRRVEHTQCCGV